MSQHDSLINLGLPEPRPFFAGREYLHCDVFPSPRPAPDFAVATLADDLHKANLPGDRSLYKDGQTCKMEHVVKENVKYSL